METLILREITFENIANGDTKSKVDNFRKLANGDT